MSNPLNLNTDPEIKQMRLESLTVFPRSINDDANGGQAHFVLPSKGYLSADSRIVIPCLAADPAYQFPPNVGLWSVLQTATLSVDGTVLAQVDNAGELYATMNHLTPPEKKHNIDSVLHGVNYVMESCSGGKMDSNKANAEVFPGQYRLKCAGYGVGVEDRVKGNCDGLPNVANGSNSLLLTKDSSTTPQYSVSLSDLFPGLFKTAVAFPVGLVESEMLLDLVFSRNGNFGANDRAVFCPILADEANIPGSSIIAAGVDTMPTADAGTTSSDVILNQTTAPASGGTGFRMLCDITAGAFSNFRVLDGGVGYDAGDTITLTGTGLTANATVHPAMQFTDATDANNLDVADPGANGDFADDQVCEVVVPWNEKLNFMVKVTADGNGALAAAVLEDGVAGVIANSNLALPRTSTTKMAVKKEDGTASTATIEVHTGTMTTVGLGYDPVWSYDSQDGEKISVDTPRVMLTTDIIYYMDGRQEQDFKTMNSSGIKMTYTQFRNVVSSLPDDDGVTAYNQVVTQPYTRQIGFSNEVLRSLHYNIYPSGTQSKEAFPYYNKNKLNPFLLKYCSRASLNRDGMRWNMQINSVPYYSSQLQTDMRQFRELNKVFGNMFINKGCYQGWNQCRQLDNPQVDLSDAAPSQQAGFTKMDSNVAPTQKYELSDVKSAIANAHWHGVNQHHLRGMNHTNGVSFKLVDANVPGNGIAIGSSALILDWEYDSTYDPSFSGSATLSAYGEVERGFVLKGGQIAVTAASF
jgi:hypothetical protein